MKKDMNDILDKTKNLDRNLRNLKKKMMTKYSSEQVELLNEHLTLKLSKKLGRVNKI